MGKKVSLILFLFIFLVKVPSLKAFTILGNQGDFNYFPEKLPSLNPSKILAQVSGELDPGINYATATWQELVESSYPLTRALGLALCNDAKFLQDYAHKLNLIELATYGFFELFALINNPLFHSPGTPRSEETKMTKFQEMVANGSIKVAINLMEEQRQGLDLESIAEQLPKNGDLRKALAKSVFLQTEAKKEIIIQMLPFFDNPQIDVNKRAQIGATFSVLNLINDARIGLSYFRE
ncbi:MAG: hypothetical protein NC920_04910, partial [Candidatus Omnitrophica bacterium]|nr:hypothetical protein [Candidatus Omnitrophota bacterium]